MNTESFFQALAGDLNNLSDNANALKFVAAQLQQLAESHDDGHLHGAAQTLMLIHDELAGRINHLAIRISLELRDLAKQSDKAQEVQHG